MTTVRIGKSLFANSNLRLNCILNTDPGQGQFLFSFFQNFTDSNPLFLLEIGALSNTEIRIGRVNQVTTVVDAWTTIATHTMTTATNLDYEIIICGNKIFVVEDNVTLGEYEEHDLILLNTVEGATQVSSTTMNFVSIGPTENENCSTTAIITGQSLEINNTTLFIFMIVILVVVTILFVFMFIMSIMMIVMFVRFSQSKITA